MSKQNEAQSTELVAVQTAITRMDKLTEGLKDLAQRFGGVVFDVKTPKGMAEAKAARREIAGPRIDVEKIRKEAKAPILELGRKLDAEAARITKELAKIEDPIAQQIKTEEDRVENERLERVRREEQRVADIQSRIQSMRNAVGEANRMRTSAEVVRILSTLLAIEVDGRIAYDFFAEFTEAAALAKRESVGEIERIRDDLVARETEAERLRKDREDFERKRAEQEAADRTRREQEEVARKRTASIMERVAELRGNQNLTATCGSKLIAEHLEDLNKLSTGDFAEFTQQAVDAKAAGIARLESLLDAAAAYEEEQTRQRAESERIARESRELEARQQAEREAENVRIAARLADEQRQLEEAETKLRLEREAEEQQRKANYRPSFDEIVALLAANYRVEPAKVRTWITDISAVHAFIGYLSGDIPQLHKVEVPELAASWERFCGSVGRRAAA